MWIHELVSLERNSIQVIKLRMGIVLRKLRDFHSNIGPAERETATWRVHEIYINFHFHMVITTEPLELGT
jgi:hypothetical protein